VGHKSEQIHCQLYNVLAVNTFIFRSRAAIIKAELDNKNHLSVIEKYPMLRYSLNVVPNAKELFRTQYAERLCTAT